MPGAKRTGRAGARVLSAIALFGMLGLPVVLAQEEAPTSPPPPAREAPRARPQTPAADRPEGEAPAAGRPDEAPAERPPAPAAEPATPAAGPPRARPADVTPEETPPQTADEAAEQPAEVAPVAEEALEATAEIPEPSPAEEPAPVAPARAPASEPTAEETARTRRELRERREQAISQSIERLSLPEADELSPAQRAALVGQIAQGARVEIGALREESAQARLALERLQAIARQVMHDRDVVPRQVRAGQIPTLGASNRWEELQGLNAEIEDAIDTAFTERLRLLADIPEAEDELEKLGALRAASAAALDPATRQVLVDAEGYLGQRLDAMQALLDLYNEQAAVATDAYDESSRFAEELSAAIVTARQRGLLARSQDRLSLATFTTIASDLAGLLGHRDALAAGYAEAGTPTRSMTEYVLRMSASILLLVALLLLWMRLPCWLRDAFAGRRSACDETPIEASTGDADLQALKDRRQAELATPVARAVLLAAATAGALHLWGLPQEWIIAALSVLGTWATYFALVAVMRELLAPRHEDLRVVPIDNEAARALYRLFRALALWTAIILPVIWALGGLGYEAEDVLVLLSVIHVCGLAVIAAWLIYAGGGPGDFIAPADGGTSRTVRRIVGIAVPVTLGAAAAVALLKALGYTNLGGYLARILYMNIPLLIVAVVADWQFRRHIPPQSPLHKWLRTALWGAVGLAQVWVLQLRWHHWQALADGLRRPLFTVGQSEISAFSFLRAIVAALLAWLIAVLLRRWLSGSQRIRERLSEGVQYALSNLTFYVILIGGVLWAMLAGGFPLNALTVLAGMAGIGLGFGLQEIVRNFVAGLILLIERPLAVGDYIEVAGTWGRVTSISLRSTIVRTQNNVHILVPNGDIITQQLTNLSHQDRTLRLVIPIGVSYDSDIDRVREVLTQVASEHPNVRDFPKPDTRLKEFADSAIVLELLAWIDDPAVQMQTTVSLNLEIWRALKREGIEIPFPQRDLHLRSVSARLHLTEESLSDEAHPTHPASEE